MKIGLEIKNISRAMKPKKDDIIIFDGKDWYVTTKKDLFGEYEAKLDEKIRILNALVQENATFKQNVSSQMAKLGETVKNFIKAQGE